MYNSLGQCTTHLAPCTTHLANVQLTRPRVQLTCPMYNSLDLIHNNQAQFTTHQVKSVHFLFDLRESYSRNHTYQIYTINTHIHVYTHKYTYTHTEIQRGSIQAPIEIHTCIQVYSYTYTRWDIARKCITSLRRMGNAFHHICYAISDYTIVFFYLSMKFVILIPGYRCTLKKYSYYVMIYKVILIYIKQVI